MDVEELERRLARASETLTAVVNQMAGQVSEAVSAQADDLQRMGATVESELQVLRGGIATELTQMKNQIDAMAHGGHVHRFTISL